MLRKLLRKIRQMTHAGWAVPFPLCLEHPGHGSVLVLSRLPSSESASPMSPRTSEGQGEWHFPPEAPGLGS